VFIRESRNRSGSISIQVIEKVRGRNRILFSAGSGKSESEITLLKIRAQQFIESKQGVISLFTEPEDLLIEAFIDTLTTDNLRIVGPQLVLIPLFQKLFSSLISKPYFQDLVLCRIIYPGSKLRTAYYLARHFNKQVSEQTIYRAMDNLDDTLKEAVESCTFERARSSSESGSLSLVFYDMTTLYFETESEDDLRITGYSKDGKHQHPQIMIGLLVNASGMPIAYDIFKGNQSETKTLIPVIEQLIRRFAIAKPIIVADAALLSKKNLEALQKNGFQYILGGRLKNESDRIKEQVLRLTPTADKPKETMHPFGRLVVSYSDKRKTKDAHNRKKGLERLEKRVRSGKINKEHINNRGYNKYLKLEGNAIIKIDYMLYEKDAVWDGLKGYVTNTKLSITEVIASYSNLWQVEKAFRMSKTDLRFRPIFHRKENRIKAHILICFAAYALYKELERVIKKNNIELSVQKAMDELREVQMLTYKLPKSKTVKEQVLKTNQTQNLLLKMNF
jgi:transposase